MAKKFSQKEIDLVIKSFVRELRKKEALSVSGVFLFGSRAKKKSTVKSDVDLCIVSPKFKDRLSASSFLNRKFYHDYDIKTDLSFDIIGYPLKDFTRDSPLVSEIVKTGRKIKT